MIYTTENIYFQPLNNNILYNVIPSQPSVIYLATPITSYVYTQPIQQQYTVLPLNTVKQKPVEEKSNSNELTEKDEAKPSIKQSITPKSSNEQLDLNLSHYGYRRELVNGDGNCFFTSIASQLIKLYVQDRYFRIAIKQRLDLTENLFQNRTQLARTLRKLVCLEWKINDQKYKPYINDINYYDEIKKFRSDKFYSSILGDILPLTISNLIGINIKIITNLNHCPLINICPQDEPLLPMKSTPTLTLAYNQENEGHYDIAVDKNA